MTEPDRNPAAEADEAILRIEADLAAERPAEPDDGRVLLPPPTAPMAVARQLLSSDREQGQLKTRHWRGSWMRWEGSHWTEVEEASVKSRLYRWLEHADFADAKTGDIKPWNPTRRKVSDVLDALAGATHLPEIKNPPAWLAGGGHPAGEIVACANGLLHVGTRELAEHTPRYFNVVSVPFNYDASSATPSLWLWFLSQLWPDDPDAIAALQEFFGYVLSGRTDLHKILLLIGPPRSGKGTLARILTALVGKGNMAGPTLASLATNFGLSPLLGKPLAVVSDARLGGGHVHQVVERLLSISGEDSLTIDRKFREPWTGQLPTRFVVLSNELPRFGDSSGAIANRFIVLTQVNSWLGKEDTRLTAKLCEELPGILSWALDGLDRLTKQGAFTEPDSSRDAVRALQDIVSPVSAFVRDRCEIGPEHQVSTSELYAAWKIWCEENGHDRPGTVQTLGRNLRAAIPALRITQPKIDGVQSQRVYVGITRADMVPQNAAHNGQRRVSACPEPDQSDTDPAGTHETRGDTRGNPLWPLPDNAAVCRVCERPIDPVLAERWQRERLHPSCQKGAAP